MGWQVDGLIVKMN